MSTPTGSTVDTDLVRALELVAEDQRGDLFYKHPFEIEIFKKNISWLERIATDLGNSKYTPSQARSVDVPKPGYHIRPASYLSLTDQVVLSYLMLKCKSAISGAIAWSEGEIRKSHWVSPRGNWFREDFSGWKNFRENSLQFIADGAQFVLVTDIAGYYENIDISRVITELKNLQVPAGIADQLSTCLNKWSGPRRRGIPQGYNPCHLLGELYLDSLDHNLKSEGFVHLRYLDDIRLFAKTEQEARRALHRVTILLRERGLNLQTAKSKVISAQEAEKDFDGVVPILKNVSDEIARELELLETIGYVDLDESRKALENFVSPPIEVIQRTWNQFEQGQLGEFDKSLFHYLLNRLGQAECPDAINYVLMTLFERPDETKVCLNYLLKIGARAGRAVDAVAKIITGADTLFAYQRYLCLRWLYDNKIKIKSVLEYCRTIATWGPDQFVVRPYAIAYVGEFASLRDFERFEVLYRDSSDWLERATIVCAYRNAIIDMRNAFYGRIKGEADLIDRAIAFAKAS